MAASKYFYAVTDGLVPLAFLFSGTLFYTGADEKLQATLIPWEKEALCKMPARLWQEMMDTHFPDMRWIRLHRDVYDKLIQYKAQTPYPTVDALLDAILTNTLKETILETKIEV